MHGGRKKREMKVELAVAEHPLVVLQLTLVGAQGDLGRGSTYH